MSILKNIFTKKIFIFLSIIIVVSAFIILLSQYLIVSQEVKINRETIRVYQHNEKILNFTKLFVKYVLKSDGAVPLSQVLTLENAARDINNQLIYDEWQKFISAKSEQEAQIEVKNLLEMLIERVNY